MLVAAFSRAYLFPVRIWHAAADVLPDVPSEPVIREGSVVHGRLTHELCEDSSGWQFRPCARLRRSNGRFLVGFGTPFLILFAAVLTWVLHSQVGFANWFIAALCAVTATLVCGGTATLLIGLTMRADYRRHCLLLIPCHRGDLELELSPEPNVENSDLHEGLKWVFLGDAVRQHATIPRDTLAAVQLCPWKLKIGRSEIASAVQGVLVLASADKKYLRLPILLTSDFVGAARLMRRLADTLHVPFLFSADAAGWKEEAARAKTRPALRAGGTT